MLQLRTKETIIRNSMNETIAIDLDIEVYKAPFVMKTVSRHVYEGDSSTTDFEIPDWDKCTKIDSAELQWLIPENKQTDTEPTEYRAENSDYDNLIQEWRQIYVEDSDYIRIHEELVEKNE